MRLQRSSPCKINLLLNVLGRRPDGFHELETVLQPVPFHDELEFSRTSGAVELTCSDPQLPVDAGNLVHRAATAFFQQTGIRDGVRIHLEKRIPLAAGLGGGSANAAHTLLGLNELFHQPLEADSLQRLAATLGSDVVFFLKDQPALATGRGESVQWLRPFPALRQCGLFLVHPGFGVSTPWVYRALARFPDALKGRPGRALSLIRRLEQGTLGEASGRLYNALELPVLEKYPLLVLFQEFLRQEGALAALMSGSGSSTFALTPTRQEAEQIRERFLTKFGSTAWTVTLTL